MLRDPTYRQIFSTDLGRTRRITFQNGRSAFLDLFCSEVRVVAQAILWIYQVILISGPNTNSNGPHDCGTETLVSSRIGAVEIAAA